MNYIEEKKFGRDHWNLLAYIEYCCMNYEGKLNPQRMRIKHKTTGASGQCSSEWNPKYGTRLKGYVYDDKTTHEALLLKKHDDLDCLDDLENATIIKNKGSGLNPMVELTKKGIRICGKLTAHKQNGGYFSNFNSEEQK